LIFFRTEREPLGSDARASSKSVLETPGRFFPLREGAVFFFGNSPMSKTERSSNLILQNNETWVPLEQAGELFPGPRKPSRTTLWRWATISRDLECVMQGKFRFTSKEAVDRLIQKFNQPS
jgi:hypothetical protein